MSPFTRTGPVAGTCPILLTSPHSGSYLPPVFLKSTRLPVAALRRIEDSHVGLLLAGCVAGGLPLLEATHSRAYLDLNRAEDELDPAMFSGPVPAGAVMTERVRRGYGLLPRIAAPNQPIYAQPVSPAEVRHRVQSLHAPWHTAIAEGLAAVQRAHGYAILLDCHSMPTPEGANPPALVLGDLHGHSAAAVLVDWLEEAFACEGLRVLRNNPYAGGHTTERHADPASGRHAIQLEFDRALYMNPETLRPHAGFDRLSATISKVLVRLLAELPGLAPGLGQVMRLAAE